MTMSVTIERIVLQFAAMAWTSNTPPTMDYGNLPPVFFGISIDEVKDAVKRLSNQGDIVQSTLSNGISIAGLTDKGILHLQCLRAMTRMI